MSGTARDAANVDMAAGSDHSASGPALFSWALYDWANSAFVTVIQTFLFAAYFIRSVAPDQQFGTAAWGNTIGAVGLLVAIGGPLLGAVADQYGRRKPWLLLFTIICVAATAGLWFVGPSSSAVWIALPLVAISTAAYEYAAIFYNAMLPNLAGKKRLGRWSGWGWSLGYAGGLACLLLALFAFVREDNAWLALDTGKAYHVRAAFLLVAVWYILFSLPLFLFTPDEKGHGLSIGQCARAGLRQLLHSFRHVRRFGFILRFLITRMIYVDGLATLFAFGGVYAAGTFDMPEQNVLLFGVALNVTAGLGAAVFAWIDDWLGSKCTILLSLAGLIVTGSLMLLTGSQRLFWIFGMTLGIFVGPVQAASRSYLARVAPPELRNEMFGLYAFSGKATSFIGPLAVGWLTVLCNSQRAGMSAIIVLFVIGFALMLTVPAADTAPEP
jgi:UMF1 family MFS transporter